MSERIDTSLGLELVGISHNSAPISVLEGLALTPSEVTSFYERAPRLGVEGALVLSTCNRTEIYAHGELEPLTRLLQEIAGEQRFPASQHLYRRSGKDGVRHLFRVASGLDSMVLGETQILGQVKQAFEQACVLLPPTQVFDRAVRSALAAARRSRGETEIGKGAVSVASAAVHLATRIYSDLSRHNVLVIGAGETGRLAAEHLKAHGPRRLMVMNRTLERAEALARTVDGEAVPLERLPEALRAADVVVCAVRAPAPLLDRPLLEQAASHRGGQPLVVLDLGLPRNVAPEAHEVRNVFLNDLETLKQVVDTNLAKRRREVPRVEAIIEEEVDKLLAWQRSLDAGPLIAALRQTVEDLRLAEVERASRGLSPAERQAVDRATRAVVNKLLHGPMTSIKELAEDGSSGAHQRLSAIREAVHELREPLQQPLSEGEPQPLSGTSQAVGTSESVESTQTKSDVPGSPRPARR